MKKHIFLVSVLALACTSVLFLDSCKKEEPDTETTSATDNALCESEFSRIMPDMNGIAVNEEGTHNRIPFSAILNACYSLSWSGDTALAVPGVTGHMFVDFGNNSTCQSADGKIRSGMVEVIFDDGWRTIGSSDTIKLYSYKVKTSSTDAGIQYDGMVAIAWTDSFTYTYKVIGGKCTKSTWEILWDCNRTMKWVQGMNDTIVSNDVFQMWGSANGTNREGKTFDVDVTMADCIIRKATCRYIVSGKLTLTPEGRNARTVDFGDGTCDDKATLIINGNSFEFTLQ